MFDFPLRDYSLSDVVEISDREDLFEIVTNEQVTEFSRARGADGFASAAAVQRLTGVTERRICRLGVDAEEVGLAIAETLERRYGFDWTDCPAIGLSHTHTHGDSHQQLVHVLSRELGVSPDKFYSINFGCVGYLQLMKLGIERLRESGSDAPVPLLTVETPDAWHDASDRSFCGIVSSAATGSLLWRGTDGHRIRQLSVGLREVPVAPDGTRDKLFWVERGQFINFRGEPDLRTVMRMNGGHVFLHGTNYMIEACRNAFAAVSPTDRRILVASHQPSGKMLGAMISVLRDELPCLEFLNHLARYANSISSTIPTVLSHLDRILREHHSDPVSEGDFVLLPAAGISMSHKSTHLAQGWAVLEW